ncbi:thioredoxin-dependent thiol peroxidase [Candidatus Peregrinibacteria bacterium]|nr:thioredoxin-dependent thiol peroxidase [Candidatus Peregrinibacteria bacterium]
MDLLNKVAPDFKLEDQDGTMRSLKDFAGKYVLLYFYPKDMTPGCTVEAQCFRDHLNDLKALNLQVLGVSCDDVRSHKKFVEAHGLNFPLLADVDRKVVEKYGVWVEKSMYGKKYMGIQRDSFLIGPDGKVLKHYSKVKPEEHADEVIDTMKTFQ